MSTTSSELIPLDGYEMEINLSDIKRLSIGNKHNYISQEKFTAILTAFVDDILLMRNDAKVEISIIFMKEYFSFDITFSYPFFWKDSNFKFPYEVNDTISHYLANVVEKAITGESATLISVTEIDGSLHFFKNLKFVDKILGFDGRLCEHFNKKPFKFSLNGIKDEFECFTLSKSLNRYPALQLSSSLFSIGITTSEITLITENFSTTIKTKKIDLNDGLHQFIVDTLLSQYNCTHLEQFDEISQLLIISSMLSS